MPELPGLCGAPHGQNNVASEYRLWWFLAALAAAQLTAKGIRKLHLETT
jgi:hypothetical protein